MLRQLVHGGPEHGPVPVAAQPGLKHPGQPHSQLMDCGFGVAVAVKIISPCSANLMPLRTVAVGWEGNDARVEAPPRAITAPPPGKRTGRASGGATRAPNT